MTLAAAKEKLHDFIDHADEQKIFELLSIVDDSAAKAYVYDQETLNMLRERSEEYHKGESKTYTVEESLEQIKKHRQKDGI